MANKVEFKYPPTKGPITLSRAAAKAGELTFGRPADVSKRDKKAVQK